MMITPQEVSQHAFSKASFGGYNMAQVDEFLDILTADYTTLYKENAVLKSKMKVLVDKVEEYRATEDAMRMTLLSAQKMANAMIQEAQEKKDVLIRDAEAEAAQRIAEIRKECDNEAFRLAAAQNATAAYVAKLRELMEHERDFLGRLAELCPPASPADPISSTVSDIEDSVGKLLSQEEDSEPLEADDPVENLEDTKDMDELLEINARLSSQEPVAAKASHLSSSGPSPDGEDPDAYLDEISSATRRIDFDNLQFGRDYEIK